jgi:hypothetical protein
MSHFIMHRYRNTEFRYQTIYDRDKRQWFAQGYVNARHESLEAKAYTTPCMPTEIEAKQAFCEWAIHWIDDNP